jgi:hypothetical protein
MERLALDVEGGHFCVVDVDAFFVQIVVEFTANLEARLGLVAAINSTTASRLVRGRPRQFCVIGQNRRCSILFHFDVPGG